ncbi:MAG: glucosidase [Verrucomicrobia bacterium]|nr:glucosidase [Verrucomicrobiota bacterium]
MSRKPSPNTIEHKRLAEDESRLLNWKRWGPYLSERQWGTVREDYSETGECWSYFPHHQAASRAYRWGEDGLLGFTDRECRLCFALALWNGKDPILKERLFGLSGPEGNHGEDVKECYYYLESTPTHSYFKSLYKYSHQAFPYRRLLEENQRRSRLEPEFELEDSGVFGGGRYFDVTAEYAKASPDDILIRITVENRGPEAAEIHLLPTLWFRNTWSWGADAQANKSRPRIKQRRAGEATLRHETLGAWVWRVETSAADREPVMLFTENESNRQKLWGAKGSTPWSKDAFHRRVVDGDKAAVNPALVGSKAAVWKRLMIPAGGREVLRLRLRPAAEDGSDALGAEFDRVFQERILECQSFYESIAPLGVSPVALDAWRSAYAGLLHSKQFYHYVVKDWLRGDPGQPSPPETRKSGRNSDWGHLFNRDVILMPDKWEYPWYAAWDLAFHAVALSAVDPDFAKSQVLLFLREWYMHPNGQLPAYEFALGDVNPPVHAWAAWRLFKICRKDGERDHGFLGKVFQKLLINFTWWVNRKDVAGRNIFAGGFLGLDNVGVFDRSKPLPTGGHLEQADGTAWMAFYCGTMLSMALKLAERAAEYEDMASKFFEHFVAITNAMNTLGGAGLWDEEDGFYYDQIHVEGRVIPLKIRSMVGLIPLFACEILEDDVVRKLGGFSKRKAWFLAHEKELAQHISYKQGEEGKGGKYLLSIVPKERLIRVLARLLDEDEFLSPYGIRSLSKIYAAQPYVFQVNGEEFRVEYTPGESTTGLFGGNSNWRGPVWLPVNYLLIEALERFHHFYGDDVRVECPTRSGNWMSLDQVAAELGRRLVRLVVPGADGVRPCTGTGNPYDLDPHWRNLPVFHEYFHGDSGKGLGASHQTGWTALLARLISAQGQ